MDNRRLELERCRRNVKTLFWAKMFVIGVAFDVPVIVLMWQKAGLSMVEIMVLQALFSLMLALFDVPSGYCADVLGRKLSLVIAAIGLLLGSCVYRFANDFQSFLVGEFLYAVGFAFASGADQALFLDSLSTIKRSNLSKQLWGRYMGAQLWFSAVASILGGYLGSFDLRWPLNLTIIAMVIYLLIVLSLREPIRIKKSHKIGYFNDLVSLAIRCLVKDQSVRWLLWYPAILGAFVQAGLWLYQPYFQLTKVPVEYFGAIFACYSATAAISSHFAHKLPTDSDRALVLLSPLLLVVFSYMLMGNIIFIFSFSFIIMQQIVRGFCSVAFSDALGQSIGTDRRATILSLQSMMQRLFYAVLLIPVGAIADGNGIPFTLRWLGWGALVIGSITFFVIRPRNELG